ncbi:YaaR family protein [Leptospira kirschneri]|uniref:PF03885 family protein n=1 Tax=Leptospira kirschneri str. 200802841 TaxID=1193047 RepID=A0A828Y5Q4_9LEPT|nr:YaaR family protein [Leptospira kirschneri]EMO74692.1 PF03885 family protein [Leptospira kirschneri str. 200801925]EJO69906.1 PF03885 family protein [Leptospira kirschneri serovar Grippotyphosa str. RM52]EKO50534.1 PF03885 family protein [Leptospira kirschneri str. 200802841]EKQ83489.1 PF03885 family protein [Leptospira kirschneri serovar Grippotyphosa str. Moskva]EKR08877.1 PF03885 family protein [Leptospira kirschneri serovar Valbuzzi str. 200702274]
MKVIAYQPPRKETETKNTSKNKKAGISSLNSLNQSETVENISSSFLDILEEIVPSKSETTKDLNALWRELPDIEKRFLDLASIENLETYQKHIQAIIKAVIDQNMRVETLSRKMKGEAKKIYHVVKIIDEKIQILAELIMNEGNSAFKLLKSLTDIRGLLLDIQE